MQRQTDEEENKDDEEIEPIIKMPLLDAVQTLVEKERALMDLKVAEATDEIMVWKEKYSVLAASTSRLADLTSEDVIPREGNLNELSHWELLRAPLEGTVLETLAGMRHLDVSGEDICASDLDFITRRLAKLARRPVLCLAHNLLDESSAKPLSLLLAKPLVALDLGHNQLGPLCLVAVCRALVKGQPKGLQRLSLEGNWHLACVPGTGDQLGQSLCDASKQLTSLHSLRLTLCDSAPNRAAVLPWQQPSGQQQQPATSLSKRGGRPLNALHFLKHCAKQTFPRSLVELALVGAPLHADSVVALASVLASDTCSLTSLDLSHSVIGASGAKVLAGALKRRSQLGHKQSRRGSGGGGGGDLAGGGSGGSGGGDHAKSFSFAGSQLSSLKLSHCSVSSSGCQALVASLVAGRNDSLTSLDLSFNGISDSGAVALAKLLDGPSQQPCVLPHENLDDDDVDRVHYPAGPSSSPSSSPPPLRYRTVLVFLDVTNNAFGSKALEGLLRAAEQPACSLLRLRGADRCAPAAASLGGAVNRGGGGGGGGGGLSSICSASVHGCESSLKAKRLRSTVGAALVHSSPQEGSSLAVECVSPLDKFAHFVPLKAFVVPPFINTTAAATTAATKTATATTKTRPSVCTKKERRRRRLVVLTAEVKRGDGGPFLWQLTKHTQQRAAASPPLTGSEKQKRQRQQERHNGHGGGSGVGGGGSGGRSKEEGRQGGSGSGSGGNGEAERSVVRCGTSGDAVGWDQVRRCYSLTAVLDLDSLLRGPHPEQRTASDDDAAVVLSLDACACGPGFTPLTRSAAAALVCAKEGSAGIGGGSTFTCSRFAVRWALHEAAGATECPPPSSSYFFSSSSGGGVGCGGSGPLVVGASTAFLDFGGGVRFDPTGKRGDLASVGVRCVKAGRAGRGGGSGSGKSGSGGRGKSGGLHEQFADDGGEDLGADYLPHGDQDQGLGGGGDGAKQGAGGLGLRVAGSNLRAEDERFLAHVLFPRDGIGISPGVGDSGSRSGLERGGGGGGGSPPPSSSSSSSSSSPGLQGSLRCLRRVFVARGGSGLSLALDLRCLPLTSNSTAAESGMELLALRQSPSAPSTRTLLCRVALDMATPNSKSPLSSSSKAQRGGGEGGGGGGGHSSHTNSARTIRGGPAAAAAAAAAELWSWFHVGASLGHIADGDTVSLWCWPKGDLAVECRSVRIGHDGGSAVAAVVGVMGGSSDDGSGSGCRTVSCQEGEGVTDDADSVLLKATHRFASMAAHLDFASHLPVHFSLASGSSDWL